jgi:hypothetical protein
MHFVLLIFMFRFSSLSLKLGMDVVCEDHVLSSLISLLERTLASSAYGTLL